MSNQRKLKDADEARAALEAAERDGRGRVAWARANGVDARSLNAWRLNLARRRPALQLVELVTEVDADGEGNPQAGCRVVYGDFVVEIDAGFHEETLIRVLSAVRAC